MDVRDDDELAVADSPFGGVTQAFELRRLVVDGLREDDALATALSCRALGVAVLARFASPRHLKLERTDDTEAFRILTPIHSNVFSLARFQWALDCGAPAGNYPGWDDPQQRFIPGKRFRCTSMFPGDDWVVLAAGVQQLDVLRCALSLEHNAHVVDVLRVAAGCDLRAIEKHQGLGVGEFGSFGWGVRHSLGTIYDALLAQEQAYASGVPRASVEGRLEILQYLLQPDLPFSERAVLERDFSIIAAAACQDLAVAQLLERAVFGIGPEVWPLTEQDQENYWGGLTDGNGGIGSFSPVNPCCTAAYAGKLDVLQWLWDS